MLSLFAFLVSCTNTQFYTDYAVRVDSLGASLEASASSFEQIDTSLISDIANTVGAGLDTLKAYRFDSVSASMLNDYSYIRSACKTILREYPLAMKELQYSRDQLFNLKHDIEHRHLEEEMIDKYFADEMEAVSRLKEKMRMLVESTRLQAEEFALLNPHIEFMIDSITN